MYDASEAHCARACEYERGGDVADRVEWMVFAIFEKPLRYANAKSMPIENPPKHDTKCRER
jgi:hypothetical protein